MADKAVVAGRGWMGMGLGPGKGLATMSPQRFW